MFFQMKDEVRSLLENEALRIPRCISGVIGLEAQLAFVETFLMILGTIITTIMGYLLKQ
jgi:hypothetical protein